MKMLNPKQRNAARRLVSGESVRDVAEELGMSDQTIRGWMKEPIFQATMSEIEISREHRLTERERDALEILEDSASRAAQFCTETLENENASLNLRMKTAWDILDRTKGKPVQRQVTANVSIVDLILMAHEELEPESARESIRSEDPIDAEFQEVG